MGLIKCVSVISLLYFLSYPINAIPSWTGPAEIVHGGWGSGEAEFGFRPGDIKDQIPENLLILSDGKIIVEDWINSRLKIYKPDGSYLKSIAQIGSRMYELDPDKIISFKWDAQLKKRRIGAYSLSQMNWVWVDQNKTIDIVTTLIVTVEDNNIFVWDSKKQGFKYSAIGQLVQTFTTKPLELGVVTEGRGGSGDYMITINYHDKKFILLSKGPFGAYFRDNKDNLNAISGKGVEKFSACAKSLGELVVPEDERRIIRPGGGGFEEISEVAAGYGKPVIAPNGDVYTYKRTPDKYSILKWTWVDDPSVPTGPDAPTGLTAMPSTTGIYLTWTTSAQDPGCVTGYEVSRATSAGGVYSSVGTVEKGVIKYNDTTAAAGTMYYYKVRAAAGTEYSPYTSEVSGKR